MRIVLFLTVAFIFQFASCAILFTAANNNTEAGSPTYFFLLDSSRNYTRTYLGTYDVNQYGYFITGTFDPYERVVYASTLNNLVLKIDVKSGNILKKFIHDPSYGITSLQYDYELKQLFMSMYRIFPYASMLGKLDVNTGEETIIKDITDQDGFHLTPYVSAYCQKGKRFFYPSEKVVSWRPSFYKQNSYVITTGKSTAEEVPVLVTGMVMDMNLPGLYALHSPLNASATVDIVDTDTGALLKTIAKLDRNYQFDGRFTVFDNNTSIIYSTGYNVNDRFSHYLLSIDMRGGNIVYNNIGQLAPQLLAVVRSK